MVPFQIIAVLLLVVPSTAILPCFLGINGKALLQMCRFEKLNKYPFLPRLKEQGSICSPNQLYGVVDDIEAQAVIAADSWSIEATPFLEPEVAAEVEKRFEDRADVIAFRVVGGRRSPTVSPDVLPGEGRRSRFVLMHPDIGLDIRAADAEYCTVIRVGNVNVRSSNTFPDALGAIGIQLDDVGDIVVVDDSTVYFVVDPSVAKQCLRLLSKELVGVGTNLAIVDDHEFMPHGEIQEMKLSRIFERQLNRKKYEKGYAHFG